jgi:predicted CXXCH cytochrome family protein
MKRRRTIALALGLGAAGSVVLLLDSCSTTPLTVAEPPAIPGASFVGNKTCAECHRDISRAFPTSAHARIHLEDARRAGETGCESCHGAGSLHVSGGGGRGKFIVNPGKDPAACFQCHLQQQAELQLPQHHPVLEKKMNCAQCHDPHGSDIYKRSSGLAMARVNETCAQCHREQTRPFIFEHPALREGCVACHSPHGSVNAKMLVQPDLNLCLRCHAQVPGPNVLPGQVYIGNVNHTSFIRMGSCWSSGCHTAVHGSNVDVRLRY